MRHHRYFFVQPHNLQISGLRQLEYFITSLVKLSPFLSTHDGSDTCQHLPNNNRCRRRRIRHVDSVETCCGWAEEGRGPEPETALPAFFAPLTSTPLPSSSRSYRARIRNFALSLSPLSYSFTPNTPIRLSPLQTSSSSSFVIVVVVVVAWPSASDRCPGSWWRRARASSLSRTLAANAANNLLHLFRKRRHTVRA